MRPPVACPCVHVIAYALRFRGKSLFSPDTEPAAEEAFSPPRQAGSVLRKPASSSITVGARERAALSAFRQKGKGEHARYPNATQTTALFPPARARPLHSGGRCRAARL